MVTSAGAPFFPGRLWATPTKFRGSLSDAQTTNPAPRTGSGLSAPFRRISWGFRG
jgi:hypothetical protein